MIVHPHVDLAWFNFAPSHFESALGLTRFVNLPFLPLAHDGTHLGRLDVAVTFPLGETQTVLT
jgi:hypothetical protein